MNTAIRAQDLSYQRSAYFFLDKLRFSIRKGEFFVIIGPNGSGKTTLMRLLSGIEPSGAGELEVMALPMGQYGRRKLAKTIAFVPQALPVDLPFTAAEVVLMGRAPHMGLLGLESPADMAVAGRVMSFTGLEHLAGRRLKELSGGECQRVFIARAICQEPQIMLLDEPTAALDLAHQLMIMDLLESLRKTKGVTVVMVSHDLNLAAMYADRLLLLKEGRMVRMGTPSEVLQRQILEETYGCRLVVDQSPVGQFPRISMISEKHANR